MEEEVEIESSARERVGQEQIQGLLFGDKLSWQSIIYDLVNSEQLNPWDIDLSLLAQRYLEKIKLLEEANFFVSSKVLLAAALLLRMKSEQLLEVDLEELDRVLYGRKEDDKKYVQQRIELDEDVPGLMPRTPLPRYKKVSLEELMAALGKAINTETRRIKKVVIARQQELETALSLPKSRLNLQDRIRQVYAKLKEVFKNREDKLSFSDLAGRESSMEEKIATFIPLLHLDNQHKVWVEQDGHLEEIWILLKEIYEKKNKDLLQKMMREVEEEMKEFESEMDSSRKEMLDIGEKAKGTIKGS